MGCWLSWARQSRDNADHNFVTVVMQELELSVQDAFDWIGRYHDGAATVVFALYEDPPVFLDETDEVNREIREYVYGLGNWVRANECWSFKVNFDAPLNPLLPEMVRVLT